MSSLVCPRCKVEYPDPMERCPADGADLCEGEALERVGAMVNNYLVGEVIGCGGMGVVYRARHVVLDKPVAIKILNQRHGHRKGAGEEMLREARAASRIHHPHIVDVTDFGTTADGSAFFVMEFLRGESLATLLRRHRRLRPGQATDLVRQIAGALAAAHQAGIVHRDLKPENIFLVDDGQRPGRPSDGPGFVKVLDFGLAKILDLGPSNRTRAGMLAGTPCYMSPEQARNLEVDGRSDIYSLGVLYYQMVTGAPPFHADSAFDLLLAHVHATPEDPRARCPDVGSDVAAVILRCLEKDPGRRFQTMERLLGALDGELPAVAHNPPAAEQVARQAQSGPTITTELAGRVVGRTGDRGLGVTEAPLVSPAASVSAPTVVSDLVARVVTGVESTPQGATEPPAAAGSRARPWLAIGTVIVVAGAAALWLPGWLADPPTELASAPKVVAAPAPPEHETPPPPPAVEPEVQIHLDGLPAEARVWLDGQLRRERPLRLARSINPREIRVEAKGYLPEVRKVVASATQWLVFDLQPERRTRRRPARRRGKARSAAGRRRPPDEGKRPAAQDAVAVAAKPAPQPKAKPSKGATTTRQRPKPRYRDWILEPKLE